MSSHILHFPQQAYIVKVPYTFIHGVERKPTPQEKDFQNLVPLESANQIHFHI